jgi:methane/ammonia monooxygenase subunit B
VGGSGKAEELITPQERMVGVLTLVMVLLVVIVFYAITVSDNPNTIPLQAGDFRNIQAIDEPPSPIKLEYVNASYNVSGNELVANYRITNEGKEPLRVSEFNTANLRFMNSNVYTTKPDYPDYLLAERVCP